MILPVIMFVVTLILFSLIMQLPLKQRVRVYLPSTDMATMLDPEKRAELIETTIERHGLDKPLPVQYVNWIRNVIGGEWGYSPTWQQPVLEGLLQRAPATRFESPASRRWPDCVGFRRRCHRRSCNRSVGGGRPVHHALG